MESEQSSETRRERRQRQWEDEDRKREERRRTEFERRGDPQRFTLKGMVYHPHGDGDGSWTLPDIDPSPERDEVIPAREDRITEADMEAAGAVLRRYGIADCIAHFAVCEALLKGGTRK